MLNTKKTNMEKDKMIIEKVKTFGLFNGQDETTVYAHVLPNNHIDPDQRYNEDGDKLCEIELFTNGILRSFINNDVSFMFAYDGTLFCNEKNVKKLDEYVEKKSNDTVLHDIVLKLRKRPENSKNRASIHFHTHVSDRDSSGIPFDEYCEFEICGPLTLTLKAKDGSETQCHSIKEFLSHKDKIANGELSFEG